MSEAAEGSRELARIVVIVGLGSNLGDRARYLDAARDQLAGLERSRLVASSPRYETDAVLLPGAAPQPRYLNAAVRLETSLAPHALLDACFAIEARLGRVRRERWSARTIDLDLLVAVEPTGALIRLETPTLTLPHPRLVERDFARRPLLDVAPELAPALRALAARRSGSPRASAKPEAP